jgi:hypothetical protein
MASDSSGSNGSGRGTRLKGSTAAQKRLANYKFQTTNPNAPDYVPF